MFSALSHDERQYLLRGVLGVVAGVLLVGFVGVQFHPATLDRPARLALEGRPDAALDAYLDVAEGSGDDEVRAEALWQAAGVAAVDLSRPALAVSLLEGLAEAHPGSSRAPEAAADAARLVRDALRQRFDAAERWEHAAQSFPGHAEAGDWWLTAGETWEGQGMVDRALVAYTAASEHDRVKAAAFLGLARVTLPDDPWRAHDFYYEVLVAEPDPVQRRLAKLGIASALEQVEAYDEALALLDELDGDALQSDAAVQRRRQRLIALAD